MPTNQKGDSAITNAARERQQPNGTKTPAGATGAPTAPPAGNQPPSVPASTELTFENYISENQNALAELLPRHVDPKRLMRLAISAVRRSPELLKCSVPSLIGGVIEASTLGLELNTPLDQAWLLPYKDNKRRTTEAQLIVGYKGMIDLFYNHELARTIFAMEVYEKDTFSFQYGTDERLNHIPYPKVQDRGEIIYFYAYAKMKNDAYRFVVLPRSVVDRIKTEFSPSASSDFSPWTNHYAKMGRKTAIRELATYIPKSAEASTVLHSDGNIITDPFTSSSTPSAHYAAEEQEKGNTPNV